MFAALLELIAFSVYRFFDVPQPVSPSETLYIPMFRLDGGVVDNIKGAGGAVKSITLLQTVQRKSSSHFLSTFTTLPASPVRQLQ